MGNSYVSARAHITCVTHKKTSSSHSDFYVFNVKRNLVQLAILHTYFTPNFCLTELLTT